MPMPMPMHPAPFPSSGDLPPIPGPGLAWLRDMVARRHAAATILGRGALASGELWQAHRLTSQAWRGGDWVHELDIVLPARPTVGHGPMLLWVGGGTSAELPAAGTTIGEAPRGVGWLAPLVAATGLPAALVRASADRKVRKQKPFAQQDIVAAAVRQWLRAHGFLL